MPRTHRRTTNRHTISEELMHRAIEEIHQKKETPSSAAMKYGLKRTTILSRIAKIGRDKTCSERAKTFTSKYASRQVFTKDQEDQLSKYFKKASQLHYGLTYKMARRFAYEFASLNNIMCPTNWRENKEAGLDWIQGFLKRNNTLSLRKPENTSMARATGFNKESVDKFFENLSKIYEKYKFEAKDVYNLDETGITTVVQAPKVIAEKGKRSVGQIVSAERGSLVTVVGVISAAGTFLPPVYIYPRKRNLEKFMSGSLPGSFALSSKKGWMVSEIFIDVLKHIQKFTKCTEKQPILLLLDNHSSHCSIEAIDYCRENGIILLSFPPHTSHKLQPLDVSVFGPFKCFCRSSFNDYLRNNPGKTISVYEISALTKIPFQQAFTPSNIEKGFQSSGIYPMNSLIFCEDDYVLCSSEVSMQTDPSESTTLPERKNPVYRGTSPVIEEIIPLPIHDIMSQPNVSAEVNMAHSEFSTHYGKEMPVLSPEQIHPLPKIKKGKQKGRSVIYTASPERERILELKENRKKLKTTNTKARKKLVLKKQKRIDRIASTDSSVSSFSLADSAGSAGPFIEEDISDQHLLDDINNFQVTEDTELLQGDFVMVRFQCKSIDKYYVGEILKRESATTFSINFFRRKYKSSTFSKPLIEDVATVLTEDIKFVLPRPEHPPGTSRSATMYKFDVDFAQYNVN